MAEPAHGHEGFMELNIEIFGVQVIIIKSKAVLSNDISSERTVRLVDCEWPLRLVVAGDIGREEFNLLHNLRLKLDDASLGEHGI